MQKLTFILLTTALLFASAYAQNSLERVWSAEGENFNDHFGGGCTGGDFNNDGYSDVLIGAYGWPGGYQNIGKDYLYFGAPLTVIVGVVTVTIAPLIWHL